MKVPQGQSGRDLIFTFYYSCKAHCVRARENRSVESFTVYPLAAEYIWTRIHYDNEI